MFNSTNYPHDVAYPIKPAAKQVKVMTYGLPQPELQAYNLELAKQDHIDAMRKIRQADISQLDGLWSQVLTA